MTLLAASSAVPGKELEAWNAPEPWKDVWRTPLDDFPRFGMTGFGDQFAYRLSGLRAGDATVCALDAEEMAAEALHPDFDDFWKHRFLPARLRPTDPELIRARRELGDLPFGELLGRVPPLPFEAEEPRELRRIPTPVAMVIAGDVHREIQSLPDGATVERIETWAGDRCRLATS